MHTRFTSAAVLFALGFVPAGFSATAAPRVDTFALAPAGKWLACTISPSGVHTAVLMPKGQQQTVWLDGVEGPAFDELLPFDGRPFAVNPLNTSTRIPVAFSEDGKHHAYLAKAGTDYILYRDGREVTRGKHGVKLTLLSFSPGGHHLYFVEADPALGTRLVMDGKAGHPLQESPKLVFSPDGKRYAYTVRKKGQTKATLFIDGEEASYAGEDPQFTRDSKTLVTIVRAPNNHVVHLDGKPLFRARHVFKVYVSPYGDQIISAVANERATGTHLQLLDKEIPDSDCGAVRNVFFSPDGKRYAALCSNHGYTQNLKRVSQGEYIFLDGKRGNVYQKIRDSADASQDRPRQMWISGGWVRRETLAVTVPGFTPDSTRFVYQPHSNADEFVVINEDASEGYPLGRMLTPVFGGGGKRIAYTFSEPVRKIVVDGEARELRYQPNSLSFSPDGTRVAYVHATICLDGVDLPLNSHPARYLFSPDSKTFAVFGQSSTAPVRGLYLDGDLVLANAENAERPVFTPDSKHLLWYAKHGVPSAVQDPLAAYVDGKPVVVFRELINTRDNWEMVAPGVLTFVARVGDALNRFRITVPSTGGVSAMRIAAKAGVPKLGDTPPPLPVAAAAAAPTVPPPSQAAAATPTPPPVSKTDPAPATSPAPTPTPDPVADTTKKATDAIDATATAAKSVLELFKKKKN